jgi:hypothetical protein
MELARSNLMKTLTPTAGLPLSAHCDTSDEITRAKEILKSLGAEDIASAGEAASVDPPVAIGDRHRSM